MSRRGITLLSTGPEPVNIGTRQGGLCPFPSSSGHDLRRGESSPRPESRWSAPGLSSVSRACSTVDGRGSSSAAGRFTMLPYMRMAVGAILILSMMGRDARAQWGFDGWGWWGWGAASPESAELHAAGQFAMGAGVFNLKTAQAMSIDADTAMKFNDYVAQVTRESARLHAARIDQRVARNRSLYDARQKQLRDNPTRRDIDTGDALNAAVADLSDPRLGRSALRAARTTVPASLIAEVPFVNAVERVSLMLNEVRASVKWPEVFE